MFESKFPTRSRNEFHRSVHYYLNRNRRFPIFPFLILQLALQAYNVNLQQKDLNRFASPTVVAAHWRVILCRVIL